MNATTNLIELAAAEGRACLDCYWNEFDSTPSDDGSHIVGDWDSQAWSITWSDLVNAGATRDDHDACRAAWLAAFWA
jgi:hypothetical protein